MNDTRQSRKDSGASPRNVNLPIADDRRSNRVRKSKAGIKRAFVLGAVQLLMIVHVVLWLLSGRFNWWEGQTISPVEPSEAMEFSKHGIVNAGLIFFTVALLSTVILGRWFCGWGCHVVMLQDGCGWLLKKIGLRPKPFRSRLLLYVPLLLALYMFVWPAAYRWGLVPLDDWLEASKGSAHWSVQTLRGSFGFFNIETNPEQLAPWKRQTHLTTDDFWRTFPGVMMAVPFLFICGFVTVYFLGMKGYCTYACPYGGFFAPLDKYAIGRIRVTDDCQQTGHCTSVCTSNVRIHDEVREYGMVVDPGCMKCLDCVSVCPNDALYFGIGKPARLKGAPRNAKPKSNFDLSMPEEIALCIVYACAFFSVRGALSLPLLFAAGVAAIVTFLVWKTWRLMRSSNVNFHRFRLKVGGRLRGAGVAFAMCVLCVLTIVGYCWVVNATHWLGARHWKHVDLHAAEENSLLPRALAEDEAQHVHRALRLYAITDSILQVASPLTISLRQDIDLRRAQLLWRQSRFAAAEQLLKASLDDHGRTQPLCNMLPLVMRAQHKSSVVDRYGDAIAYYRTVLSEEIRYHYMLEQFMLWMIELGQQGGRSEALHQIITLCRARLERAPDDLPTLRWLSQAQIDSGNLDEAKAIIERTIEIDPTSPGAYLTLADIEHAFGRLDAALDTAKKAEQLLPDNPRILTFIALTLEQLGRLDEAEDYKRRAEKAMRAQQVDVPQFAP